MPHVFDFLNQTLHLLPQKAVYWEEARTLLLADWHLGKVSHFRKAGIAVPADAAHQRYAVLDELLRTYPVARLLVLGDLFHSDLNAEWTLFAHWLASHPGLETTLVKGNHDILPEALYALRQITVHPDTLRQPPFVFSHIPPKQPDPAGYCLSGHLHPAVRLRGPGNQQLTLPCFYFGKTQGLLPAFGSFTGHVPVYPENGSHVFVVTNERVLPV